MFGSAHGHGGRTDAPTVGEREADDQISQSALPPHCFSHPSQSTAIFDSFRADLVVGGNNMRREWVWMCVTRWRCRGDGQRTRGGACGTAVAAAAAAARLRLSCAYTDRDLHPNPHL